MINHFTNKTSTLNNPQSVYILELVSDKGTQGVKVVKKLKKMGVTLKIFN